MSQVTWQLFQVVAAVLRRGVDRDTGRYQALLFGDNCAHLCNDGVSARPLADSQLKHELKDVYMLWAVAVSHASRGNGLRGPCDVTAIQG